jgi:hypothetical protein
MGAFHMPFRKNLAHQFSVDLVESVFFAYIHQGSEDQLKQFYSRIEAKIENVDAVLADHDPDTEDQFIMPAFVALSFSIIKSEASTLITNRLQGIVPSCNAAYQLFMNHNFIVAVDSTDSFDVMIRLGRFLHRLQPDPSLIEIELNRLKTRVAYLVMGEFDVFYAQMYIAALYDLENRRALEANAELYLGYLDEVSKRFVHLQRVVSTQDPERSTLAQHLLDLIEEFPGFAAYAPEHAQRSFEYITGNVRSPRIKAASKKILEDLTQPL